MAKIFSKFLKGYATGYLTLILLEGYEKLEDAFISSWYTKEKSFRISNNVWDEETHSCSLLQRISNAPREHKALAL